MANIFEFLSKDGNITPERARKSRQMQFHDKKAYVWGLRYRWDPSLSRKPVPALYATLLNAIPICWESMNLFWEETEAVRQVAGAKWFIKHFTSPDRDR